MNMDDGLVNRALLDVGQQPLTAQDRSGQTVVFVLARTFYLQTFLESLQELEWTGGKKRARLALYRGPLRRGKYRFAYTIPVDCAKPIELRENDEFVVEGDYLYTDQRGAELEYVTSGRRFYPVVQAKGNGPGDEILGDYTGEGLYIHAAGPGDDAGMTVTGLQGIYASVPAEQLAYAQRLQDEDYPEYQPPRYDHVFYGYIERKLAAKFAAKLANSPELHMAYMQEAMGIREGSKTSSLSMSASKVKREEWWTDRVRGKGAGNKF